MTERQRGFLGAFLLMLVLVVGQFAAVERKISFRSVADPALARSTPEKAAGRAPVPKRPLSAGGEAARSDNWLLTISPERRAAKAKATNAGGGADPATDVALFFPVRPGAATALPETRMVVSFARAAPDGAPRHDFEGRAPPAHLL